MNWIKQQYYKLTPSVIPKESQFLEKGILLPREFMEAGDRLIEASPIWRWEKAASPALVEKTLKEDKQFLAAQVVSRQRLGDTTADLVELNDQGSGWTNIDFLPNAVEEVQLEDDDAKDLAKQKDQSDSEEVLDSDDDSEGDDPKKNSKPAQESKLDPKLRTYNVYITYDRHYLTPRFWLSGTDSAGKPLTKEQIFEEVMGEYKDRTVTFDKHPHLDVHMANVHPCRHAAVLQTLASQARANGNEIRPEHSLFVFLKFIASVMPALEIDFTTEIAV